MSLSESPELAPAVLMKHPERVQEIKVQMRKQGVDKFFVLSDFAKTLTREYVDGVRVPPVVSQLRDGNFLSAEYAAKAHALYDHYAPLEQDLSAGVEARNEHMLEWWRRHFELLLQSGFSQATAKAVAAQGPITLREKMPIFIRLLEEYGIPLVIVTATPGDLALAYFAQAGLSNENIHLAGNVYLFDANGQASAIPDPIVHTHNKGSIAISSLPFADSIKDRSNVLLLGDSLEDLDSLKSVDHQHALTVGFYNKPTTAEIDQYRDAFDIVLTGDGSMEAVNELISDIFA